MLVVGDTQTADSASCRAAANFDIRKLTPEFLENPYPTYRALRKFEPVHLMPDGSYFLTRYDDCLAVYRDTETWSSDKKLDFRPNFADSLLYEHHTTSLVFNDPPYHTRVRKLWRPRSRRGRCANCRRGSRFWSIVCWKQRPNAARST